MADESHDNPMPPDHIGPEFIEPDAHSFVVHIWFEKANPGSNAVLWRGRITHVASGKGRYLTRLSAISDFIATYLYKMGIQPSLRWRVRRLFYKSDQEQ